jgi:hypothetical protein
MTLRESVFSIKLGNEAVAVARRWKGDVEIIIYDSENRGAYLSLDQWKRMIHHSEFLTNGSEEIKKEMQQSFKRVTFEFYEKKMNEKKMKGK